MKHQTCPSCGYRWSTYEAIRDWHTWCPDGAAYWGPITEWVNAVEKNDGTEGAPTALLRGRLVPDRRPRIERRRSGAARCLSRVSRVRDVGGATALIEPGSTLASHACDATCRSSSESTGYGTDGKRGGAPIAEVATTVSTIISELQAKRRESREAADANSSIRAGRRPRPRPRRADRIPRARRHRA